MSLCGDCYENVYTQWRLVAQIDGGANIRQWYIITLLYNNNNNNM
jgi:hypothetical protein